MMKALQRLDQQKIHRKPDRAAPIRIAPKQAGGRFARFVADAHIRTVPVKNIRVVAVITRESSNPVIRKKLAFIQHPLEQQFHAMTAQKREKPAFAAAHHVPSGNQGSELASMVQEPLKVTLEMGYPVQKVSLKVFLREERYQANDLTAPQ